MDENDNLDIHYYLVRHQDRVDDSVIDTYVQTIIDIIKGRKNVKEHLSDLLWMLVEESIDQAESDLLYEDIHSKIELLNAKHIIRDDKID